MRPRVILALGGVALALAGAGAQAPARDAPPSVPPPSGTAGLAGIVRNEAGEAVRRATVTISGDMRLERMTVTDDEGRFAFADLPGGRFTVTARKAGYPERSYGAGRPFRAGSGVFLQDGQQARDLVLTLARGAVLAGTVYDARGEPMPRVPVMAWEIRTSLSGERTLDAGPGLETIVSDDRGQYRVYGLPPGEFTIGTSWYYSGLDYDVRVPTDAEIRAAFEAASRSVTPGAAGRPAPPPQSAPRYNFSPMFAPGVVDPLSAATYLLAPGEVRTGVDLRMQFQPMSRIEGTIVTPDGAAATARLTIARRSPVEALNTMQVRPAQMAGPFTTGSLSPGLYSLLAEVAGRDGAPPLWAMADVVVGGGEPVPVTLVLQPAVTITGRLVFEGARPPADLTRVIVSLRSLGSTGASAVTAIDASGAITITGVIPGRYRMIGSVPASALAGRGASAGTQPPAGTGWAVRSVTLDEEDVTDRAFDIGASGASNLTVTFTDRIAELTGTITTSSGAPATDYFIIAIPFDRAYWLRQSRRIVSTRPDAAGRYAFGDLPAGEYLVALTTDLVPRDLQDPAALERLAAQSVPVTIRLGERSTLDLRTAAGGG